MPRPSSSDRPAGRGDGAAPVHPAIRMLRRPAVRIAGILVGLALLAAAIAVAVRDPAPFRAVAAAAASRPAWLALLPLLILGNVLAMAGVFHALISRFGAVGRREMIELIAASTLLNFVPLRPGLVGRVGWHATMNGIPPRRSVQTLVESIVIAAACIAGVLLAAPLAASTLLPAAARPILLGAALLLAPVIAACTPLLHAYALPGALRALDLLLWTGRYLVAFSVVGSPIPVEAALTLAAAAAAASLVPLAGNGLGLREWTVGLLAPFVARVDVDAALAADLLNRAAELLVIIPAGLVAVALLVRRVRRVALRPGPRP